MPVRDVLQLGDPRLKQENLPVVDADAPDVRQAIEDLTDTMRHSGLVGMAAPQIGTNLRIIVTEPRQTETRPADQADILRVYINPRIVTALAETSLIYEGCGSVMHGQLFGPVIRPRGITVEATGADGRTFRLTCDGLLARVIQHEYDHLDGIEFTEKISDYRLLVSREWYLDRIREDAKHKRASLTTRKECVIV
jgi:peptide deformylase